MPKKKLENMTSEEIKKLLMNIDKEIKMLQAKADDLKKRMTRFLTKRQPDEFTKSLYPNQISLKPNAIQIFSERLQQLNKDMVEARNAYIKALREEMIVEFVAENPDCRDDLKSIEIEKSESGTHAKVYFK